MAAPYAAVTRAGAQVAKVGDEMLTMAIRLERQKEDAELTEVGTRINDDFLLARQSFEQQKKGKDAFGSQAWANEFVDQVKQNYREEGKSERYNLLLEKHIDANTTLLKNHLAAYEAAQIKAYQGNVRTLSLESSKKLAAAGEYDAGLANHAATLNNQLASGDLTKEEHQIFLTKARSDIAESFIKTREPVAAKAAFEALKGELLQDVREKMEPGIQKAAAERKGIDIGTAVYKENPKATVMSMIDKIQTMKLDVDTEKAAIHKVSEFVAVAQADEQRADKEAHETFIANILPKVRASGGYLLPSHLSGPKWEAFKAASPTGALTAETTAGHNVRTLAIENKQDRITALQLKAMEQNNNRDKILASPDFKTRVLMKDFTAGTIGFEQLGHLMGLQNKLDPLKHDAVREALNKIRSGETLPKALNLEDKNQIAAWRLKYTTLVKDFVLKHAEEPDFENKLNDFMERKVLSEMVKSWFSLDETDRQRKFMEAQVAAGVQVKVPSPTASPTPTWQPNKNDLRKDGSQKGTGFLGVLPITYPNGKTGVATEYSINAKIGGKDMEIPTLVPTLNVRERERMQKNIIPNNKPVPRDVRIKAISFAMQRVMQGKSVFAEPGEGPEEPYVHRPVRVKAPLDAETALWMLNLAKGDKELARKWAREGYQF
jgi:hypothetical protein